MIRGIHGDSIEQAQRLELGVGVQDIGFRGLEYRVWRFRVFVLSLF